MFFPTSRGQFAGIIGYLNDNFFDELYTEYVSIYPSSIFQIPTNHDWIHPDSIVNFKNQSLHWASSSEPNSSITVHFKKNRVSISHYTMRSRPGILDNTPKSWILEGSMDNETWTLLHSKQGSNDFSTTTNVVKTYQVIQNGVFYYLKFTQTGPSSNDSNVFHVERVDFFGTFCSQTSSTCLLPIYYYTKIQKFSFRSQILIYIIMS